MRLVTTVFLSLVTFSLLAQEEPPTNNLLLDGFLKLESGAVLPNHSIKIKKENGEVLNVVTTDETGRFRAYFPFDEVLELWCSNTGYHTKILVIDTRSVPKSKQKWGFEYGGFEVTLKPIGLENKGVNRVAILKYSSKVQGFDFELH